MKIWIDGYEANQEDRVGSGQFAFEVNRNLEKLDHKNEYTILLPDQPLDDLPKERPGWNYKILKPNKLWTRIVLPLALYSAKQKPDLIFSPTHYIPRFSPVKRVVTIFDLAYLHFPEMFTKKDLWQLKNWSKYSIENADHIITISQSTKKDIIEKYKVNKNKITLAYPGYDRENFQFPISNFKLENIKKKYEISGNYIIYIGTIQPRKNLVRLMEAFARIVVRGDGERGAPLSARSEARTSNGAASRQDPEQLTLVIVGKTSGPGREGWKYDEILSTPKRLGIEDRVVFTGFVPTEDLPVLLSGAEAFVLPSLWEGFGIPLLEAMACGAPVIASNVSSLPEVVGKAGLLVDPYSVDQIEMAIRNVITDKKLREKLKKLGLEQSKKFSWERCSREILRSFHSLRMTRKV